MLRTFYRQAADLSMDGWLETLPKCCDCQEPVSDYDERWDGDNLLCRWCYRERLIRGWEDGKSI